MKLKITTIVSLFNGLCGLDGLQKSSGIDGQPPIFAPYKFRVKFTMQKVKLINILRLKIEEYKQEAADLAKQHKVEPGDKPEVVLSKTTALRDAMRELDESEREVEGLSKFKEADLNLYDKESNPSGNVIAATIIEQVMPLLEDDAAKPE